MVKNANEPNSTIASNRAKQAISSMKNYDKFGKSQPKIFLGKNFHARFVFGRSLFSDVNWTINLSFSFLNSGVTKVTFPGPWGHCLTDRENVRPLMNAQAKTCDGLTYLGAISWKDVLLSPLIFLQKQHCRGTVAWTSQKFFIRINFEIKTSKIMANKNDFSYFLEIVL